MRLNESNIKGNIIIQRTIQGDYTNSTYLPLSWVTPLIMFLLDS